MTQTAARAYKLEQIEMRQMYAGTLLELAKRNAGYWSRSDRDRHVLNQADR